MTPVSLSLRDALPIWVIVTAPQVSLPVAWPVPAGLVSSVHSTVLSEGTVKIGRASCREGVLLAAVVALLQESGGVEVRAREPVLRQSVAKAYGCLMRN